MCAETIQAAALICPHCRTRVMLKAQAARKFDASAVQNEDAFTEAEMEEARAALEEMKLPGGSRSRSTGARSAGKAPPSGEPAFNEWNTHTLGILVAAVVLGLVLGFAFWKPPAPEPRPTVTEVLPMEGSGDDRTAVLKTSDGKTHRIPVDSEGRPR